jgi:hypothetical protein
VHGKTAGRGRIAPAHFEHDADLVCRRMDVLRQELAFAGFHAGGAAELDVLAKPSDELEPLLLETGGGLGPVGLHCLQHGLGEA